MISELVILAVLMTAGYFIGGDFGFATGGVVVGLLLFIGLYLLRIQRLQRYLHGQEDIPVTFGTLWKDIHAQIKRLEQCNEEQSRGHQTLKRFQTSVIDLPLGIVFLSSHDQIEWLNRAASRLLGLRHPEDVGRNITYILRQPEMIDGLGKRGGMSKVSLHIGQYVLDVFIAYLAGRHVIIVQDMTHLVHLQNLHRELLSDVSHELRSPLTVVQGYAEMLDTAAAENIPEISAEILHHAREMNAIINDLLSCDMLETQDLRDNQCEVVDVAMLIREVTELAERFFPKKSCTIETQISTTDKIYGSRHELKRALSNLVHNALRYSSNSSTVQIGWYADNTGGHLTVTDWGKGIAADHIPRLTERFYRVDKGRSRESGGIGLGLAIVKRVLQRHQARLYIESTPGKGSIFRCDFAADVLRAA